MGCPALSHWSRSPHSLLTPVDGRHYSTLFLDYQPHHTCLSENSNLQNCLHIWPSRNQTTTRKCWNISVEKLARYKTKQGIKILELRPSFLSDRCKRRLKTCFPPARKPNREGFQMQGVRSKWCGSWVVYSELDEISTFCNKKSLMKLNKNKTKGKKTLC